MLPVYGCGDVHAFGQESAERALPLVSALVFVWVGSTTEGLAQASPGTAATGGALPDIPESRIAPAQGGEVSFPIPLVIDGPLAVGQGKRLFISNFEFKGTVDRPEVGITLDKLEEIVETSRIWCHGLDELDEGGSSDEERTAVAGFVSGVEDGADWGHRLGDDEVLVGRLREGSLNRDTAMTICQMQAIANAITQQYCSAGFATDVPIAPFQDLIDTPVVVSLIEPSILALTDLPGLRGLLGGMGDSGGTAERTLPSSRQTDRGALTKFASNDFIKFNATVSHQQRIDENLTALFRFEDQYSRSVLTSS